ncbi:MAG: type II toxin-antitoxin system HicA family toxin [Patescibacteria group bacterium]
MKRTDFIRHLFARGCVFVREGAKHSVLFNPAAKRSSTVPRHAEIHKFLVRKICRDLGVDKPKRKA